MKKIPTIFFVLAVAATGLPSIAHEHATGVVKERMDAMTDMARHQKAISECIRGKGDLARVKSDAKAIAGLASHIVHMFPSGSMQEPTRARRAIWQNWTDFDAKARTLEAASRALAGTSPTDAAAVGLAAADLTRACSACHEKYRARK